MLSGLIESALQFHRQGDLAQAAVHYRQVLEQDSKHFTALHMLGVIERDTGDPKKAFELLAAAQDNEPDNPEVLFDAGLTLLRLNEPGEALKVFHAAVTHDPNQAAGWFHLGQLLRDSCRPEEAEVALTKASDLKPDEATTLVELARVLCDLGKSDAALERIKGALAISPESADAWRGLGQVHWALGDHEQAKHAFKKAESLAPDSLEASISWVRFLEETESPEVVIGEYERVLEKWPDRYIIHTLKAGYLFSLGRFEDAWPEYKWRHQRLGPNGRTFNSGAPAWNGESVDGKRIILGIDQGLGEQFMFMSSLRDLAEKASIKAVEIDQRILPLAERTFPDINFVPWTKPTHTEVLDESADFLGAMGDFGQQVRPSLADFPLHPEVLQADSDCVAHWHQAFSKGASGKKIVGLTTTSHSPMSGPEKSIALSRLTCLTEAEDVVFINLQYGDSRHRLNTWAQDVGLKLLDFPDVDPTIDVEEHGAQIMATELVIAVSNSTAHLSAALGHPTWVLVPYGRPSYWYWKTVDGRNPWYPTVATIQQKPGEDWGMVARKLAELP